MLDTHIMCMLKVYHVSMCRAHVSIVVHLLHRQRAVLHSLKVCEEQFTDFINTTQILDYEFYIFISTLSNIFLSFCHVLIFQSCLFRLKVVKLNSLKPNYIMLIFFYGDDFVALFLGNWGQETL